MSSAPVSLTERPLRPTTPPPPKTCQAMSARLTKLRAEEAGVAAALKVGRRFALAAAARCPHGRSGLREGIGGRVRRGARSLIDRGAPIHWLPLGPLADVRHFPRRRRRLAAHVKAPAELARRLAFIGMVADEATGAALQADLKPGQQLVTAEGAGLAVGRFHHALRRPSTAAVRLSQRNRLADSHSGRRVTAEQAEAQSASTSKLATWRGA